jgi:hypothetical protein
MSNLNPNPRFPHRFLAMEEPPSKILIDFEGGRQKSPSGRASREKNERERERKSMG